MIKKQKVGSRNLVLIRNGNTGKSQNEKKKKYQILLDNFAFIILVKGFGDFFLEAAPIKT